jgi:hypothetical protein
MPTPVPRPTYVEVKNCGISFEVAVGATVHATSGTKSDCNLQVTPPAWEAFVAASKYEEPEIPITMQVFPCEDFDSAAIAMGFAKDGEWAWGIPGSVDGKLDTVNYVHGPGWEGLEGSPWVTTQLKSGGYGGLGNELLALAWSPGGRCVKVRATAEASSLADHIVRTLDFAGVVPGK